ncbi:hypothetical protein V6615_08490 [Oscillospiraceae bacterium PP1C4]
MLVDFLKKLANLRIKSKDTLYYDVDKQKEYLASFPEPKDEIERSFFQYQCQNCLEGNVFAFVTNFIAMFVLLPYVFLNSFRKVESLEHSTSVFIDDGLTSRIIPSKIREKYGEVISVNFGKLVYLNQFDRAFLWKVYKRYPLSFYFLFKCAIKIAIYRAIINRYHPQVIIAYNEFSFTSSLLTQYCQQNQIRNINVMHGEKVFTIQEAFASFHEYYVWDTHYVQLFLKMRQNPLQFIIEQPEFLHAIAKSCDVVYDFKYYLGNDNATTLQAIDKCMLILQNKGYRVCVRPHPRITVFKDAVKYITHVPLEACEEKDCIQSIQESKAIIAQCSTVHLQGYFMNKVLVVDDISNPFQYAKLLDMDFIIITKPHLLLSDVLEEDLI